LGHGPVQFYGRSNVCQGVMGIVPAQGHAEIPAKRAELVVNRRCERLVFMEQPKGALQCAKNAMARRKEDIKPVIPFPQKWPVENRIVGDQLGHLIGTALAREQIEGGVSPEKRSKFFGDYLGRPTLLAPTLAAVVILAQRFWQSVFLIKEDFGLEGL